MPKVSKETMQNLTKSIDFPPRHKTGCERNILRCLPMLYLAKGLTPDEINAKLKERESEFPCTCGG